MILDPAKWRTLVILLIGRALGLPNHRHRADLILRNRIRKLAAKELNIGKLADDI